MYLNLTTFLTASRVGLPRVILCVVLVSLLLAPMTGTARAANPAAVEAGGGLSCRWTHIYSRGETLGVIARWYGISVSQLRAANPFLKNRRVRDGEILCIPSNRVIWDNDHWPNINFRATVQFNHVIISGSRFPLYHEYAVRVRINRTSDWFRLANVRADKDGDLEEFIRLPPELRNARYYEICLKEQDWGYSLCSRVDRRWGQSGVMTTRNYDFFHREPPESN